MKLFVLAAFTLLPLLQLTPAQAQERSLYSRYCYTSNGELGWKRSGGDDPFNSGSCDSMGSGSTCGSEDGGLCVGSSGKLGQCVARGSWPNESSECLEFQQF